MSKFFELIKGLLRSERGQDVIEYALISALVSVGIIAVVLASGLLPAFGDWAEAVADAMTTNFPVLP